jgi:hypothetical protein
VERFGPDLIDVVTARWLPLDDPSGALDGVGVVNAFAFATDQGRQDVRPVSSDEAGRISQPPRLTGLNGPPRSFVPLWPAVLRGVPTVRLKTASERNERFPAPLGRHFDCVSGQSASKEV